MPVGNAKYDNPEKIKKTELVGKQFEIERVSFIDNTQGQFDKEPMNKAAVVIKVDGERRTVWFEKPVSSKSNTHMVDVLRRMTDLSGLYYIMKVIQKNGTEKWELFDYTE